MNPLNSPLLRGIALILTAIALFDVMAAIIKYMGASYSPQQLSMFRCFFGVFPAIALLFVSRDWHRSGRPIKMRQWPLGLLRGLFVAIAQFCYYTSLANLEFALAATLTFAGPLFVTGLSVPVLKAKVGLWRWIAVLIGFTGLVMIMQPGTDIFTFYVLLPLCAAFGYASSSVSVKLIDDGVPTPTINLYATAGALAGAVFFVLVTDAYRAVGSAEDWMWLFAMGLAGGLAVFSLVSAYRQTAPSNLAPFEYFGIPLSFAIGWLVFGETPFDRLVPGVFLIVAGGIIIFWRERYHADRI
ncbi:DMT family transporter [Hwanghaeella sp.]|uniref:DMT family transporter n=1 Tax=Hwanghaeella sp. TaxID=2605943 RepID=UPI003CCBC3DA